MSKKLKSALTKPKSLASINGNTSDNSSPALRDVPKLAISSRIQAHKTYASKNKHDFHYAASEHIDMPHVVKFSGGRSSGMLLFTLLENHILKAERGDVVIFNNTSAEHPATYEYARECKHIVETQYGIPFFWIEFQTYEDARSGEWTRLPTYRLVTTNPLSESEPSGYHWKGEVFEEMLSWSGFVPNQFQRICTRNLKLESTRTFLKDWFACKKSIEHLGHYAEQSRIDLDLAYDRHLRNGGEVPRDIFLKKKAFAYSRPVCRQEQHFADFSPAFKQISNPNLSDKHYGNQAFFGENGVEYAAFVGLRYDEMRRVVKVRDRNGNSHETTGFAGEYVYMPLADMLVTNEDVQHFWSCQDWDLRLVSGAQLSNCVYCFLKGTKNLRQVHISMSKDKTRLAKNTPCDIKWWQKIEKTYGRDLAAEGRVISGSPENQFIGFFGTATGFTYDAIAKSNRNKKALNLIDDNILPCDCTD